ncbi:hypothetical protein JCM10450v2_005064 [Rhodotorula kratochvilovae]
MPDTSLLPPLLLVSLPVAYIGYRIYRSLLSISPTSLPYDPKTGVGRGAPGFQTGVRRVAIPPALAARIRAGEDVSAEEVTAALEAEKERIAREEVAEEEDRVKLPEGVDEEWLPAGALGGKNKARRRKK